jgi:hypothetical protein
MTIKELEELAREFIIGYAPLTEKQLGLIISIRAAEERRNALLNQVKRYDRVIAVMYRRLAE